MKKMKTRTKKMILRLGGLLILAALFSTGLVTTAFGLPQGVSRDECIVTVDTDGLSARQNVSLRRALYYASQTNPSQQACRKKISIQTDQVHLKSPLEINITNASASATLEIIGKPSRSTLNFAQMTDQKCAVVVKGNVHNVKLTNISIENTPSHAICIEDNANHVVFDNVKVAQTKNAGDGLVIGATASEIEIKSNSVFDTIQGNAINIKNINPLAHIALDATDRLFADQKYTDSNGTIAFTDPMAQAHDISMAGVQGQMVLSAIPDKVLIGTITNDTVNNGLWTIEGAVVKNNIPNGCLPYPMQTIDSSYLEPKLERLQVYAIGTQQSGSSGGSAATFLTYVTKQSKCVDASNCSYGIQEGVNPLTDTGNFGGLFSFKLDTATLLSRINQSRPAEQQITEIKQIVMIPEMSDLTVGNASAIILLQGGDNSQSNLCRHQSGGTDNGGGTGNGGSGSNGNSLGYIANGYTSIQECAFARAGGRRAPESFDSDGDGLTDNEEDPKGDCDTNCSSGTHFSCWNNPDSDIDGIPDGAEKLGALVPNRISGKFCQNGTVPGSQDLTQVDLCDVDGDGISNAMDPDSDGDSLPDYKEDRARAFIINRSAHFYNWNAVGNIPLYRDNLQQPVDCGVFLADKGMTEIGSAFALFLVNKDHTGTPQEYNYDMDEIPQTKGLMLLNCRNDSIKSSSNLNGRYDPSTKGETHLYSKDTDGDTHTDDVCAGKFIANTDGTMKECRLECDRTELYQGMSEEFLEMRGTERVGLKLDTDRIPLIFKQSPLVISQNCSDIDQDGIPDCVENPTGTCDPCNTQSTILSNLCQYRKDSDGDNKVDGVAKQGETPDVCPLDKNDNCDKRRFYTSFLMLAHFLDRDGDELRDGEEDKDMDGIFESVGGIEARATTETDPLKKDTDGDNVDDSTEVQKWGRYTNPADPDTDDDGLPDGLEVIDYNVSPNRVSYSDRSGSGCSTFNRVDPFQTATGGPQLESALVQLITRSQTRTNRIGTNPSNEDTDGDGVKDGIEVVGRFSGDIFSEIANGFPAEGIDMVSNPLAKDSDGDILSDSQEYGTSGIMDKNSSNPCAKNTDHDGIISDKDEKPGCATNPDPSCLGPSDNGVDKGVDSDGDGLPDVVEDLNQNGRRDPGETDAFNPDSDGDHLSDGIEKQLLTDPLSDDSDHDCISDEKELGITSAELLKAASVSITVKQKDGTLKKFDNIIVQRSYSPGANTNPMSADTDGDGLCDGNVPAPRTDGTMLCIRGEDSSLNGACNGILDKDPKNPNIMLETDPRNPDTDSDGANDKQEMCAGGSCNLAANIGNATTGRSTGCFSLTGNGPADPASMLYVFGVLVMLNRMFRWSLRKREG